MQKSSLLSLLLIGAIGLVVTLSSIPAQAQEARRGNGNGNAYGYDQSGECRRGACAPSIVQIVRRLQNSGLGEEEFNSRLGVLASNLFERARDADDRRTTRRVAMAIAQLARFSTDERQRESFLWVARAIRKGDDELFDLDDPFAVSPS